MNDHQVRLLEEMVRLIERFRVHEDLPFTRVVDDLEALFNAAGFPDEKFVARWYELWSPLEEARGLDPDASQPLAEALADLERFLRNSLETDH